MGIVAGYVRVSSRQQRDEGDSPANQRARLRAYGCEVIYEDLAVSGYSTERRKNATGWRALQDAIRKGEISKLVATRLDRYARRDTLVLELADLCDQNEVDFGTLAEGAISTKKAIGWFSVKQQLLMGEFYSRQLSENISAGYEANWERGKPARGPLPFHLQRDPEKPAYEHVFVASPAWGDARKAVEMFLDGQPTTTCASFLRGKGHIGSRSGFLTWIRNPILQGHAGAWREDRIRMANVAPPLITAAEAEQIEFRLKDNKKRWGANAPSNRSTTILPLSRICSCFHCGKKLHQNKRTGKPRKDGTKLETWYLRCGTEGCEAYLQSRRHEEVEYFLENEFLFDAATGAANALADMITASERNQIEAAETVELREELKALLKIPEKRRAKYQDEINELKSQIKESRGLTLSPAAEELYRRAADNPFQFVRWFCRQNDADKNEGWTLMTDTVFVDMIGTDPVRKVVYTWGEEGHRPHWSPGTPPEGYTENFTKFKVEFRRRCHLDRIVKLRRRHFKATHKNHKLPRLKPVPFSR